MDKRLTRALNLAKTARQQRNGVGANAINNVNIKTEIKELKNEIKELKNKTAKKHHKEFALQLVAPFVPAETPPNINHVDNIFIKTILNKMLAGEIEQAVAIQLINQHYSERIEEELQPFLQDPQMTREKFLPIQKTLHEKYDKEIKYFIKLFSDKLQKKQSNRNKIQTRRRKDKGT